MRSNSTPTTTPQRFSRRSILATLGAVGAVSLSGCLEDLTGRAEAAATDRLISTTTATPAAFYAGEDEHTDRPTRYAREYIPITVRGELQGRSQSVQLDGWGVDEIVFAQDYNSTRSNRRKNEMWQPPDDEDTTDDQDEDSNDADRLREYFSGTPAIGHRFAVTVPDATFVADDRSLVDEITPTRLFEQLARDGPTDATDDGKAFSWSSGGDNTIYCWGGGPQESSGSESSGSNGGSSSDSSSSSSSGSTASNSGRICGRTDHLTIDLGGSGRDLDVAVADRSIAVTTAHGGTTAGSCWELRPGSDDRDAIAQPRRSIPDHWGEEYTVGDIQATPQVVCSCIATPVDGPPIPAVCYVQRIRHDGQYLFVGGWTIDDAAIYEDSTTILISEDVCEVVSVEYGEVAAMRRSIQQSLHRDRSAHGATPYDGLFDDTEVPFLPRSFHGDNAQELRRHDGRSFDRYLLVPLDAPIAHLSAEGDPCDCTEQLCCPNLIPAVSTNVN